MKSVTGAGPRVSPGAMRVFAAYSRRYVRRKFRSFRILKSGLPRLASDRPLVVYLNHAAWWDPLVCLQLSREFYADRTSFAPIEAAMLERYGFFKKLGFFGIEPQSARGARTFLRVTRSVLSSPKNAVWLTPQGRFADARERPPRLQDGLGALGVREPGASFVPLAIEYVFWTEPRPEILVSFGDPLVPANESVRSADGWTQTFAEALAQTQDALAASACRRDPAEWQAVDRGSSGVGGVYDLWRRFRARMGGGKFDPDHNAEAAP